MALIRRLQRITRGRIEAFLASLERPEAILPVLVDELGDALQQAARAEAKALSAVRGAQRKADEAVGRATRMQRGAELAVAEGDTDLARRALAAQLDAERQLETHQAELEKVTSAYDDAHTVRQQLQEQHDWLRSKAKELKARATVSRETLAAVRQQIEAASAGRSVLDAVGRMEAKVERAEDEAGALSETARQLGPDLADRRLEKLARDAEVQRRLDELRPHDGQA